MSKVYKVVHKKSNVLLNGEPKLPSASTMEYGEIAINYAASGETLSIKNSNGQIVTFPSRPTVEKMIDESIGGGNNGDAQVRTSSSGETNEGDIYEGDYVLTDGILRGAKDNIYTLVSTSGTMTFSFMGDMWDTNHVMVSRWTGEDWEDVLRTGIWDDILAIKDVVNDTWLNSFTVSLSTYFTPDTGDVAKIKLRYLLEWGSEVFVNVGANNATYTESLENFGGVFYKRAPANDAVRFTEQSLSEEEQAQVRANINTVKSEKTQKLLSVEDNEYYEHNEGDIYYKRSFVKVTGSNLVNNLTSDYVGEWLCVEVLTGASSDGVGTIVIHDDDNDRVIYTIETETYEGDAWATIYDANSDYYGDASLNHPFSIPIFREYGYPTLTISSTGTVNAGVYDAYPVDTPYEIINGTEYPRRPAPDTVEANPTVPAGTTPTVLAGLKIGNNIYSATAHTHDQYSLTSHTHDIYSTTAHTHDQFISGITFNGTAVTVTNGIAAITGNTLPSVTSSDNGKIAMVQNGVWSLVMPTTVYTGEGTPQNSLGNNGDIYLQTS